MWLPIKNWLRFNWGLVIYSLFLLINWEEGFKLHVYLLVSSKYIHRLMDHFVIMCFYCFYTGNYKIGDIMQTLLPVSKIYLFLMVLKLYLTNRQRVGFYTYFFTDELLAKCWSSFIACMFRFCCRLGHSMRITFIEANVFVVVLHLPGMTGPPNSFTARGPVTLTAILFTQPAVYKRHSRCLPKNSDVKK